MLKPFPLGSVFERDPGQGCEYSQGFCAKPTDINGLLLGRMVGRHPLHGNSQPQEQRPFDDSDSREKHFRITGCRPESHDSVCEPPRCRCSHFRRGGPPSCSKSRGQLVGEDNAVQLGDLEAGQCRRERLPELPPPLPS
jgi:hypothetical protein